MKFSILIGILSLYLSVWGIDPSLLEHTTWVVPPETLLAYEYKEGDVTPLVDQTVWVIDTYDKGYFFGTSYTYLSDGPKYSKKNIVGSITKDEAVYITFFSADQPPISKPVNGIGILEQMQDHYQFVMQMNSASNSNQGVAHWSYMVPVTPNHPYYQSLPGVETSIPEFLKNF